MLHSTSYRLHLSKFMDDCKKEYELTDTKLQLHQYLCLRYFTDKKPRGILLYHMMGTGKTWAGAALAESTLEHSKAVLFISKQSIHDNFRRTVNAYAGNVSDKYKFLTLGSSALKRRLIEIITSDLAVTLNEGQVNADDYTFIIDEAHNFFAGITNGSDIPTFLYNLIMRSNCRIIFMSGSPAVKEAYELGICFNMLCGYLGNMTLFGENYADFIRYFIVDPEVMNAESNSLNIDTRNMEVFGDRITGLISYYRPSATEEAEHFPKMYGPYVFKIPMSPTQYDAYNFYRTRERKQESQNTRRSEGGLSIPKGSSSTYRVMSRQLSNFSFPDYASVKYYDDRGNLKYNYDLNNLTDTDFTEEALAINSPKLLRLLRVLQAHTSYDMGLIAEVIEGARHSPGIIYSTYIEFGVRLISRALDAFGYETTDRAVDTRVGSLELSGDTLDDADDTGNANNVLGNINDISDDTYNTSDDTYNTSNTPRTLNTTPRRVHGASVPRYAIISGEVDLETQAEILRQFNDPSNVDGSVLYLLLISSTGAEGLDIKRGGHVHIYEPHWHDSRHNQVIARLNRYDSHIDMPYDERNFCAYFYLSDYPVNVIGDEDSTDVALYNKAQARQVIINKFLGVVKTNAVDCTIHGNKCRICSPTDESLIINDLSKHIEYGSKCIINETIEVNAYPFMYGESEYYYYLDGKNIKILRLEPLYNEYIEITVANADYYDLLAHVNYLIKQ